MQQRFLKKICFYNTSEKRQQVEGLFLYLFLFLLLNQQSTAQISYTDVAIQKGITATYGDGLFGGGVSFCDFNNDGWDDLTFCSQNGDSLYFYLNHYGTFQKIDPPLVTSSGQHKQAIWVDYDNDGDKDLFVTSFLGQNRLYSNDGNLNLTDVTTAVGIPLANMPTFGAAFGDIDKDGDLDLYITNRSGTGFAFTNYLYENVAGQFVDITAAAGVADAGKAPFCATFFDYNNDGWEDLYLAQDKFFGNTLLKNMGDGTFTDTGASAGANLLMDGMCVAIGDFDNNHYFDIYITNTAWGNKLLKNNANETFTEIADAAGVGFYSVGWGSNFLDFDNDTDEDIYMSGAVPQTPATPSILYENIGSDTFNQVAGFVGDATASYCNAIGDFNHDGFADIVVNNEEPFNFQLWQNNGANPNNWLKIALQGTLSNKDGIGSRVEIFAGGGHWSYYTHTAIGYLAQNANTLLMGLGANTIVDSVKVTWQSNHVDVFTNVCANTKLTIIENTSIQTKPQIAVNQAVHFVEGDSILLSTGSFETYLWSNGATTQSISVTQTGNYTVSVNNQFGFCGTSLPVAVLVSPPPTADAGEDSSICEDESEELEGAGGLTYAWSPTATLSDPNIANPIASPTETTTYSLTVTDIDGFTATDEMTLTVFPTPAAHAGTDTSICLGETYTFTASGGTEYLWSNGSNMASFAEFLLATTTYSLSVTDVNGCEATDDVTITVNSLPELTIADDPNICEGAIATLLAVSSDAVSFTWNNGMSGSAIEVSPLVNTDYSVSITDVNGCVASEDLSVVVQPLPVADAGSDQTICLDETATLTASGGVTYEWSNGVKAAATFVSPATTTTYSVVVTDALGCSDIGETTVTVEVCPVVAQIKLFLENVYIGSGTLSTILFEDGLLPLAQPFNRLPWNYAGTESVATMADFPPNVVDWVFIEARERTNSNFVLEQKAALLLADGSVVGVGETSTLTFDNLSINNAYFISVKTRNHLAVMSAIAVTLPNATPYDMSQTVNVMDGANQLADLGDGNFGLFGGDFNSDGLITVADFNLYSSQTSILNQYVDADCNMDKSVTVADFNCYNQNSSLIGIQQVRY